MRRSHKMDVRQAAAQCPEAKIVEVPDEVIAAFPASRSVWDSLYFWLIAEHGATEPGTPPHLHNRTRAGKELMARLRRAERARIKKTHPLLPARELAQAVSWSDMDSGPQSTFDGYDLVGNALFFTPPKPDPLGARGPVEGKPGGRGGRTR